MRTKYINCYCKECAAIVDHVQLSYVYETILVCMLCQNETIAEESMKKSYVVETIQDIGYNTDRKRRVIVQMRLINTPEKATEKARTEVFEVEYSAYGDEHYTASVCRHPGGAGFGHLEAQAISHEIKKFLK